MSAGLSPMTADFQFENYGTTSFENAKLTRKNQRQLNAIVLCRSSAATKQKTQCKSGPRLFRRLQEKEVDAGKVVGGVETEV